MKAKLQIITGLLLTLVPLLRGQTADDYVSQGRASLGTTNLADANRKFSAAVALSPNHPAANVFFAVTRLLVLPSQPAGSNFMNRLQMPAAGRDIYNWTSRPPADTNHVPLAPGGVNASEFTAILRTNVLPAILDSQACLAKVTDTNFILSLTSNETRIASVTLDYADIQMLRAMLHAAEYAAYTFDSWNLDAQLSAIRAFYTNEQFSIERALMDYPNLLNFSNTNDLLAAKTAFQNGVERYLDASRIIRARSTNLTRLFNYDPLKARDEERFRLTLVDLTNSLNEAVPLSIDTNYTVFLSAQFTGMHPPRSFLPVFREDGFALGTLPDPTFGGLIYGIVRKDIDAFLAEYLSPIPTMAPALRVNHGEFQFPINVAKGRGYVVQVSTNLLNWSDYLSFISLGNSWGFLDSEASHVLRRYYRVVDRTGKMPPPANDNFENRSLIPGMNIPVLGYTEGASSQKGEPWSYRGHTVWWTWTSPVSAVIAALAKGESDGWQITVYTGNALDSLTSIAWGSNQATFTAQSGMTYQISVDANRKDGPVQLEITHPPELTITSQAEGQVFTAPADILISGSTSDPDGQIRQLTVYGAPNLNFRALGGNFAFIRTNVPGGNYQFEFLAVDNLGASSWNYRSVRVAPQNDNFANAQPITGMSLVIKSSNAGAMNEQDEPKHGWYSGGASVWWAWTAPTNGMAVISASITNPSGLPRLGVYTGRSLSNLTNVASDTAKNYGEPANVIFQAKSGITYFIAIDGGPGDITLNVDITQPPLVTIISPTNKSRIPAPANVTINVNAIDPDGGISRVEYFSYSLIGVATNSPFSLVWSNLSDGDYTVNAMAFDNLGVRSAMSDPIVFTVSSVVTLAARSNHCWAIALDPTHVYWTEPSKGIMKVPKAGGDVVSLAQITNPAYAIAAYGEFVYWAESDMKGFGAIRMVPKSGGQIFTLVSDNKMGAGGGIQGLIVDSSGIYWVESGSDNSKNLGSVRKLSGVPVNNPAALANTTPISLATNLANPSGLASDDRLLYWLEYNWTIARSGAVKSVPKTGGAKSAVVTGLDEVSGIAVDSTNVYFGIWNGNVYRVPKTGGKAVSIGGAVGSGFLGIDDEFIYSTPGFIGGDLFRIPKSGGETIRWSSGGNDPYGIAADQSGVYWTECPTCYPAGGFIQAVRKK